MQYKKAATNTGLIAAAAAVAGAAAYLMKDNGLRVYRTIDNDYALDQVHTRELARVSPEQMYVGAGITVALGALLLWALKRDTTSRKPGIQQTEETIDINVPVSTAYNQWTQFEEFPRFMPTVQSVKQVDDTHLHWKAMVAGKQKEWDSEITQQIPDQLIEWRSTGGVKNGGTVTFDKIGENKTRVFLRLWYEPQDATEKVGGLLGGVKLTAKGNLKRFKQLLETRGAETGAWRGEVAPQH
jgi:uncharacterized membrane protein